MPRRARYPGEPTITWLEQGLVIGAFIIFCGTFDTLLTTVAKPRTEGTSLFQSLSGGIYLSGIALLLYRGVPRGMIKVLFYSLPLILLVLGCMFTPAGLLMWRHGWHRVAD